MRCRWAGNGRPGGTAAARHRIQFPSKDVGALDQDETYFCRLQGGEERRIRLHDYDQASRMRRKAPERIETARLVLRRPRREDAEAIFSRYASDREALQYVSWPAHDTVALTHEFLSYSDVQWAQWPAGPFLALSRGEGTVLGSTGLAFDAPERASTGYVIARDAWGRGYATEALGAMVALAPTLGVRRLYAICHVDHRPSARVLEKGGIALEGVLKRYCEFPNLESGVRGDVFCYVRVFPPGAG